MAARDFVCEKMKKLRVLSGEQWRRWLAKNHDTENEVWLVFYKRHTGKPNPAYEEMVEEALCFGWIDSLVKRIDDDRYARKFTPRRSDRVWSRLNRERAERMIRAGRMTPAGMRLVEAVKSSGAWSRQSPAAAPKAFPQELSDVLAGSPAAKARFETLAPSHRKKYILWIASAKKPETRQRRACEAVRQLESGEEPGLK